MTESRDVVTVEREIAASPEAIFALLVDPSRHREIDGSGTVRDPRGEPQTLRLGSRFGMSMRMGVPYAMVSTVIEFEQDRRIAWQTNGPTVIGKYFGGRIWRYVLEPTATGTHVSETWDITHESAVTKPLVRAARDATAKNMAASLDRIASLVAS